jgi:hypothetical protein
MRLFYRHARYNKAGEVCHATVRSHHRPLEPPPERFLALLVRYEVEALMDSLSGKPIR